MAPFPACRLRTHPQVTCPAGAHERFPFVPDEVERGAGRFFVAFRDRPREPFLDGGQHRVQADRPGQRDEPAEKGGAGQRAAEVSLGQRRGRHYQPPIPAQRLDELVKAKLSETVGGASGSLTGSWVRIGLSSIRQNDITGAPIRSEPKPGDACVWRPSLSAAAASSSAAEATP